MSLNCADHAGHHILAPDQTLCCRLETRPVTARAFTQQLAIESHLADYENKLRAENLSDRYIRETARYIRNIARANNLDVAKSITAVVVTRFASQLRDAGKSARTVQVYLSSIEGFMWWLSSHHKLARDPLASVKKPSPKADRRRERGILLPDE